MITRQELEAWDKSSSYAPGNSTHQKNLVRLHTMALHALTLEAENKRLREALERQAIHPFHDTVDGSEGHRCMACGAEVLGAKTIGMPATEQKPFIEHQKDCYIFAALSPSEGKEKAG